MGDPITIRVRTSSEGLEIVEELTSCGVAAALVSLPHGWQVEVAPELPRHPFRELA